MLCVAWSSLVEESTAGLKGTDASVWPLKHGEVHSTVCEALTRLLDSEAQWHGQDSREVEAQWHFINPHIETSVSATWYQDVERVPKRGTYTYTV